MGSHNGPKGPTIADYQRSQQPKLIYNIIFAALLILCSVLLVGISNNPLEIQWSSSKIFVCIAQIATFVVPLLYGSFLIATGISLIMRKKIGYIFALVVIVLHGGISMIVSAIGVGAIYYGVAIGEHNPEWVITGIMILLIYVPILVLHSCSWFYYKKHKGCFTT